MTSIQAKSKKNMAISIAPIRKDFLVRARSEGIDDLGQEVRRVVAEGGEPCRDVLRRARPGENLILASYTPFAKKGPYREFGPVFILAEPSDEAVSLDRLPPAGGPSNYLQNQFIVRAYSSAEDMSGSRLFTAAELEETVEHLLDSPDAAFLHVRFPTAGCFAFRIDRAAGAELRMKN